MKDKSIPILILAIGLASLNLVLTMVYPPGAFAIFLLVEFTAFLIGWSFKEYKLTKEVNN